jgi:CBS domain-containing protein
MFTSLSVVDSAASITADANAAIPEHAICRLNATAKRSAGYTAAVAAGIVLLGLLAPAIATAQQDRVSTLTDPSVGPPAKTINTSDRNGAIALTAHSPWLAPVGHRQPQKIDVPQNEAIAAWERQQRRRNAELDRKLIICRGCWTSKPQMTCGGMGLIASEILLRLGPPHQLSSRKGTSVPRSEKHSSTEKEPQMRVQDILRKKQEKLVVISPDASIRRAAAIITNKRVGMLLVVDARDELIGLLSERDVVCFIVAQDASALTSPVRTAMTDVRLIATPDDPVADVMRAMTEQRARHVPVMSERKLVGVISVGDILKFRLAEKDQEVAVLRDMARVSLVAAVHAPASSRKVGWANPSKTSKGLNFETMEHINEI